MDAGASHHDGLGCQIPRFAQNDTVVDWSDGGCPHPVDKSSMSVRYAWNDESSITLNSLCVCNVEEPCSVSLLVPVNGRRGKSAMRGQGSS